MASNSRGSVTRWALPVTSLTLLCLVSKIMRTFFLPLRTFSMSPILFKIGSPPMFGKLSVGVERYQVFFAQVGKQLLFRDVLVFYACVVAEGADVAV